MFREVGINRFDKLPNALEAPPADGVLSDFSKEALHLVEPRAAGGSKVDMVARVAQEPTPDLVHLMGGVVIQDNVDFCLSIIGIG